MNPAPDRTDTPVAGAEGKLARWGVQVQAMRSGLVRLMKDAVRTDSHVDHGRATRLVEANEALVVAALASQVDAETAVQALKNAPRFAAIDALTQLPTRTTLFDRFEQAVAHAKRRGWRFALLFLDLDHFKSLNDMHGHAFGDKVLQRVAENLVSVVREEDTVSRHGGDEFIILLTELSQPRDALAIAEKLIAAVSVPAELDGHDVSVTASVGVALYPDDGEDVDTLVARADAAMYESKRQGGGGVASHDAGAIQAPGLRPPRRVPTPTPVQYGERQAANLQRRLSYLREANETLVLAALNAQALQAAAEEQASRMSRLIGNPSDAPHANLERVAPAERSAADDPAPGR